MICHLPCVEAHAHAAVLAEAHIGNLAAAPPQHPALPHLDPSSRNRGGAEALVAVRGKHGRENTGGRRRTCERACDAPEPFGIDVSTALLARLRVELPAAPIRQARMPVLPDQSGNPTDVSAYAYTASLCW